MIIDILWCHVRHLNLGGVKLCRITKKDREIAKSLNYNGVEFPVGRKNYCKISVMNKININVFCYEGGIDTESLRVYQRF